MYKNKKILAIIPARGGSKGIPNKNITVINGKPLIAYTIEEALKSNYIDRVVVSTDSVKIQEVCKQFGAEVPFIRPEELSSDNSKSIDVVLHCIEFFQSKSDVFQYVLLLQPTSPLRICEHINKAMEKIIDLGAESLISVCEVEENPILMRTIIENNMREIIDYHGDNLRRQELPIFYKFNGAIYINSVSMIQDKKKFVDNNTIPFIMDKYSSLDIDEPLDLIKFKYLLDKRKDNSQGEIS